MGNLADVDVRRGLPRGRGSLPPAEVASVQRERMLRAMTSAVAELGYANVRIADVVERAHVSRHSFYAQFADKEECFLAAHAEGIGLILARLGEWAEDQADPDPRTQLNGAIRAYLSLASEEPEFARGMLVELPAIGPAGVQARLSAHRQIATVLGLWHEQARRSDPTWPSVPTSRYAAAVGAVHDLLFDVVAGERRAPVASLQDHAVDAVVTLLQIPPDPA